MSKERITAARLRELLHYDPATGIFTRLTDNKRGMHVGDVAGGDNGDGYLRIGVDGRVYRAHRLAWLYMTGEWPAGEIDHEDHDTANNRWSNLRDGTHAFNQQNRVRPMVTNKDTGLLGVRSWGHKFAARLCIDNKVRVVGVADTPEAAHALYVAAKREHHAGNTL